MFKDSLRGELMGPDDLAYKDARMIWNRLIDKRPALIARCADANDVVRSVRFAREHELAVAVRGGRTATLTPVTACATAA